MDLLKQRLAARIQHLPDADDIRRRFAQMGSVYPFNEVEYMLATLIGRGCLSLNEYYQLRDEYTARNRYLSLFEISAPRGFGEKWAQGHLQQLVPHLEKPTKRRDPDYSGQYDFLLGTIRIEVKASRAVDANSEEPLYVKALASTSERPFDMNFQQIKPGCCDVFVWVAVWRDVVRYWVLNAHEVEQNRYYSAGQHRGNQGEGQLHLTDQNTAEFRAYEVRSDHLEQSVMQAFQRGQR